MTQKQYFYKLNHCPSQSAEDPNCICWHNEGTGPLPDKRWSIDSPNSNWREKPMTKNAPEEAYRVATYLAKLYTRLDDAKTIITDALDELPVSFDDKQLERLQEIRRQLIGEMAGIFNFSTREAHRICNQVETASEVEPDSQPMNLEELFDATVFPPDPTFMQVHNIF